MPEKCECVIHFFPVGRIQRELLSLFALDMLNNEFFFYSRPHLCQFIISCKNVIEILSTFNINYFMECIWILRFLSDYFETVSYWWPRVKFFISSMIHIHYIFLCYRIFATPSEDCLHPIICLFSFFSLLQLLLQPIYTLNTHFLLTIYPTCLSPNFNVASVVLAVPTLHLTCIY